ncbi:hypothetical protein Tco_1004439 [Tanacetum coccineum]|uniref:Uncharacterized protein n=1 Tax=Tanacetum coccineum TaxID=301880 RepID=A0ABQ5FBW5_9ASTR
MNAYDQEFFHESDDEPYDENDFCCNEDPVASYASASHMAMTASDKDASALRVAMLNLVLDVVPFVHDSCLSTFLLKQPFYTLHVVFWCRYVITVCPMTVSIAVFCLTMELKKRNGNFENENNL